MKAVRENPKTSTKQRRSPRVKPASTPPERQVNIAWLEHAPATDLFLTKEQIAAVLKVTPRAVNLMMARGQIPYYRILRTVRFSLREVQEHFATNALVRTTQTSRSPISELPSSSSSTSF